MFQSVVCNLICIIENRESNKRIEIERIKQQECII